MDSDKIQKEVKKEIRKNYCFWRSHAFNESEVEIIRVAVDKTLSITGKRIEDLKRKERLLHSFHIFVKDKEGQITDLAKEFTDFLVEWSKECDDTALGVIHGNLHEIEKWCNKEMIYARNVGNEYAVRLLRDLTKSYLTATPNSTKQPKRRR